MYSKSRSTRWAAAVLWTLVCVGGIPDGLWVGRSGVFTLSPDGFFSNFNFAAPDPRSASVLGTQGQPLALTSTIARHGAGWIEIRGLTSAGKLAEPVHRNSAWFEISLANDSGVDWAGVAFELQAEMGVSSPQPDGLAFADVSAGKAAALNLNPRNPWQFTANTADPRARTPATPWVEPSFVTGDPDRMIFTVPVASGHEATFRFIISQNGRTDPVWLRVEIIPEPSSAALAGLLLVGLTATRRLRRRR